MILWKMTSWHICLRRTDCLEKQSSNTCWSTCHKQIPPHKSYAFWNLFVQKKVLMLHQTSYYYELRQPDSKNVWKKKLVSNFFLPYHHYRKRCALQNSGTFNSQQVCLAFLSRSVSSIPAGKPYSRFPRSFTVDMNVYSRFYKTHECQQDYLSISISWMNFDWVQNVPKVSSWCCAKWWGLKLGEMPWRVPCLEQHQQIPWQLLRKHLGHCPPGKGLETLADGNFVERKMSTEIFSKLIFGIIVFYMTKTGDLWLYLQKNISPFRWKLSLQRLRNRHRCSPLHAPRRPSVQPHWLERRPPPGGIKKLTPGMKRWT